MVFSRSSPPPRAFGYGILNPEPNAPAQITLGTKSPNLEPESVNAAVSKRSNMRLLCVCFFKPCVYDQLRLSVLILAKHKHNFAYQLIVAGSLLI